MMTWSRMKVDAMRWYSGIALAALTAACVARPASAQEWQVARQSFAFAGASLKVHVDVDAAGSIQILRGAPGSVHVAARTEHGFTDAGLTATELLTLAASGPGPVDYIVSIPQGVWVSLQLPGRVMPESIGSWDSGGTFQWTGREAPAAPAASAGAGAALRSTPAEGAFDTQLFTTYTAPAPARTVSVDNLTAVRSITVRLHGSDFRIGSSRPLAVEPGDPERIEIRPAGGPLDLVVQLPEGALDFTLMAGGDAALVVRGDRAAPLCSPYTDQQLSDGQRWVTFTPADGTLRCTRDRTTRHEG